MAFITLDVKTKSRMEFQDITTDIREVVRRERWSTGTLMVFCPHTTAAITINESADPSVQTDIQDKLATLIPQRENYRHMEGNSDAHIKSSIIGASEHVIIDSGGMVLGTWQGIFFCEFDGPRSRKVHLHFSPDKL